MSAEPTVDVFTVVLCLRLMDLENLCVTLERNCAEKKKDKLSRRFSRAAETFKSIRREIENDAKQGNLL